MTEPEPLARHQRVLSFDGGPAAYVEYLVLQRLIEDFPGMLDVLTRYVGTSAGSYLALWLAARPPGHDALDWLRGFEPHLKAVYAAFGGGFKAWMRLFSGRAPMTTTEKLRDVLRSAFGNIGMLTLGDLYGEVTLAAYGLDLKGSSGQELGQAPDFINKQSYPELSIVDAALRSSAFPLVVPIYEARVDGAVFANNPAMVGVVDTLRATDGAYGGQIDLRDFRVLSLGGVDRKFGGAATRKQLHSRQSVPWGMHKWLFQLLHPLLLLNLVYNAQPRAASATRIQLLGEPRFQRVAPSTPEDLAMEFVDVLLKLDDLLYLLGDAAFAGWLLESPNAAGGYQHTREWIENNWLPALDVPEPPAG